MNDFHREMRRNDNAKTDMYCKGLIESNVDGPSERAPHPLDKVTSNNAALYILLGVDSIYPQFHAL